MFKLVLLISAFWFAQVKAQVITDSILIEERYRTFLFKNPGDEKKSSLMFVMHGSGGNGKDMMSSTTRLEEKAKNDQLC
jgi:polyhydroxybutyrate depolymerase